MITYVGHRLASICIEDSFDYASKRKVFGKKLIDSEVIRQKVRPFAFLARMIAESILVQLAHMTRLVEAQQTWIEVHFVPLPDEGKTTDTSS
jgi:hypothetical protein